MFAVVDLAALLTPIVTPLLQTLGVVLAGLLVALAHRILKKYNISLSAEEDAKLELYAKKAAAWVQEEAARRLTRPEPNLTGDQKAQAALDKLKEWLPHVDPQKAADTIQAVLPQMGLGAAASQAKAVSTTVTEARVAGGGAPPVTTTTVSETAVAGKTPGTPGQ